MWIGDLFLILLNDLNEEKEVEPTGGKPRNPRQTRGLRGVRARWGAGARARVRGRAVEGGRGGVRAGG